MNSFTEESDSHLLTKPGVSFGAIIIHSILLAGLVVMVAPFLWMLTTSVKMDRDIFRLPPEWIPHQPTLANYKELFGVLDFLTPFKNTVIVAIIGVILTLFICSMAAYCFAKLNFPGRDKIFLLFLGSLMIPSQMIMIPNFLLLKYLAMVNTYQGIIIPGLASAFNIFFLRQFIRTIPDEIIESARIDGAGEFRIFSSMIIPIAKPALATIGILSFAGSWNNFLWPLIVATDTDMYTLPVALATLNGQFFTRHFGLLMAGALVVVTPILIVFFMMQKYFISGITMSGINR